MANDNVQLKKKATFKKRNNLIVVTVVAVLIVISLAAFEINNSKKPAKDKDKDDEYNGPPKTGNWIIDKEVTVEEKDLVLSGNLTIASGGNLHLLNSTLKIGSSEMIAVYVSLGGELHMIGTALMFEASPTPYILQAAQSSIVEIKNSEIPFEILVNATESVIEHNTIVGKFAGIYVASSSNTIAHNIIKGIDFPMMDAAITIENGTKNTISHNVVSGFGIGISLDRSNNNTIYANNISATTSTGTGGAGFQFMNSYDNEASYNEFTKCSVALNLIGSKNNKFHYNNFLDNTKQVQDDASNKFDDGTSGNFWSEYVGFDLNKDGKGDLPYVISLSDRDNHPFMKLVPRP
jgi:parallel beta-helix repeat protein